MEEIKAELNGGITKPSTYKSVEEYDRLRKEKGILDDENELVAIQNEAALIKQSLRKFSATAGQGVSEEGRIGAVSEAERNASFRLEDLAIRENSVLNRLKTKNAYISDVLKLTEGDYNQAYQEYTNEYNKNYQVLTLLNNKMDEQKKDALTAINTTMNLLKDKQVSELSPTLKTQLETHALTLGLDPSVVDTWLNSPDKKTDKDQEYKSGSMVTTKEAIASVQSKLDASRGQSYKNENGQTITPPASDKYANTALYLQALDNWKKSGGDESDFFKEYPPKLYLNPNDASVPQYIKDMLKKQEEEDDNPYG